MISGFRSISSWFSRTQGSVFENASGSNELLIKSALTKQLNRRVDEIQTKYDGRGLAALEDRIDALLLKKDTFSRNLDAVKTAIKKIDDIRVSLLSMQTAVDSASPATFDTELDNLNRLAGRTALDPTNLIGSTGRGNWGDKNSIFTSGGLEAIVKSQFLGSDYVIDTSGGTRVEPNLTERTLDGVSFDSLTLISLTDNAISYSDGSNTITGDVRRGGLSVLNAWAYNDLSTSTDQANATADIDYAVSRIASVESNLKESLTALNAMTNNLAADIENVTDRYNTVNAEQLESRAAELKSVRVRFELSLGSFSLLSSNQLTLVNSLFLPDDPSEKQNIFNIISG